MRPVSVIFDKFRSDERGTMAIELLLAVPVLTWILMSTFVYFDLFRNEANAHRAALTVADMFSREQTPIDNAYLDGARSLLRTITLDDPDPTYRLTVYRYQDSDKTYRVVWSENRGLLPNLTDEVLETLDTAGRLPILADGDRSILLETRTVYSPPFDTGIHQLTNFFADQPSDVKNEMGNTVFRTFTVIRPRFTPTLCWDMTPPQSDLC